MFEAMLTRGADGGLEAARLGGEWGQVVVKGGLSLVCCLWIQVSAHGY